ncbi:MAG: 4'-phosphopantetheinyl transferase superfamily protein [Lawsonibacter sp.]|nr:4'-phosphopantetheinyl transferase superfamily protein [Lawsonibacter sp.]
MILYGAADLINRRQAYDLLARAASEQWGLLQLPAIALGAQGKPYFSELNRHEFNLSHSGSLALCGLDDSPVGVDIQVVKPRRADLPRRVCSDQELAWLERDEQIWTRFALLWALKECRVKHSGTGLTRPISGIRVPLPDQVGVLSFLDGLWFRTYGGAGWRGAVCGQNPPPELISWLRL